MNSKEFESVLNIPANKRYEYFIKKVIDFEELWGLALNKSWASSEDDEGNILVPFWPKKEYAQYCAIEEWGKYSPRRIDLNEFIDEWIPDFKEANYSPSIFPNNIDSAVVKIETLLRDLERELENY